jgi:hypothetical protein
MVGVSFKFGARIYEDIKVAVWAWWPEDMGILGLQFELVGQRM